MIDGEEFFGKVFEKLEFIWKSQVTTNHQKTVEELHMSWVYLKE